MNTQESILKVAENIKNLYESKGGGVGGYGHIVFDDDNIEDSSIDFCINEATNETMKDVYSNEVRDLSLMALNNIKELNIDDRQKAIDLYFYN